MDTAESLRKVTLKMNKKLRLRLQISYTESGQELRLRYGKNYSANKRIITAALSDKLLC